MDLQNMAIASMLPQLKDDDRKKMMQSIFEQEKKPMTKEQEREALLKLKSMVL